jgi:hypothetical protein
VVAFTELLALGEWSLKMATNHKYQVCFPWVLGVCFSHSKTTATTRMEGSTNQEEARWQEVSLIDAGPWPARRHGHTAVVCHHSSGGGPVLCVYGGFGDDGRPLDDLFLFAFRTHPLFCSLINYLI